MPIGRRAALAGATTSLLGAGYARANIQIDGPVEALASAPQQRLWPGEAPGGLAPGIALSGPPKPIHRGAVDHIARPFLAIFRPLRPNGAAMLVSGGGGYRYIDILHEVLPAACWLNALGITAYALVYRLPPEGWLADGQAPLADAQRAIRLIRAQSLAHGVAARETPGYGLDPARVGVMGFSAGGHLSAMAATCADRGSYCPIDASDVLSCRPDIALLLYPVISVETPYQTNNTSRVLLAHDDRPATAALWSAQTHVSALTPPVFMAQAADDPIVSPDNTAIMEASCLAHGVEVERKLYRAGRHGFGMGRRGTDSVDWPAAAQAWLAKHRFTASDGAGQ